MYERSGSQFFQTTTGIQSGQDAFDESRFVITFLTILGVTEISCSFRLILEGKTGQITESLLAIAFWYEFFFYTLLSDYFLAFLDEPFMNTISAELTNT